MHIVFWLHPAKKAPVSCLTSNACSCNLTILHWVGNGHRSGSRDERTWDDFTSAVATAGKGISQGQDVRTNRKAIRWIHPALVPAVLRSFSLPSNNYKLTQRFSITLNPLAEVVHTVNTNQQLEGRVALYYTPNHHSTYHSRWVRNNTSIQTCQ